MQLDKTTLFTKTHFAIKALFNGTNAAEKAFIYGTILYYQSPEYKCNYPEKIDVDGLTYIRLSYSAYMKLTQSKYSARSWTRFTDALVSKGLVLRYKNEYYRALPLSEIQPIAPGGGR